MHDDASPREPSERTAPAVVPWEAPVPQPGPAPGVEFAGHGPRLAAYLIDSILLIAVMAAWFGAALAVGGFLTDRDLTQPTEVRSAPAAMTVGVLSIVVLLVLMLGYFPFFWARWGQTPGMKPFRLWIVMDRDGSKVGAGRSILRMIGMYFVSSIFYLGFIWIFVDKRRRSWHDLIAGTVVIHRR